MPRFTRLAWGVAGLGAVCMGLSALATEDSQPEPASQRAPIGGNSPGQPAPNAPQSPAKSAATPATSQGAVLPPRPAVAVPAGLLEAIRAAKGEFTPVSDSQVQAAWGRLWRTAQQLNATLRAAGKNGTAWKQFLHWDVLERQFQRGATLDLQGLRQVHAQFRAGEKGLEHPQFLATRAALEDFIHVAATAANPAAQAEYQSQLEALAAALESHARTGAFDALDQAGATLGALDASGRAPSVVSAVRRAYSQPNLLMDVSADLVVTGLERKIDDVSSLNDNILGTRVVGTGHTVGKLHAWLVEDSQQAIFQTELRGVTASRTVGYNGPVIVYSNGISQVRGAKQMQLDAEGFHSSPARSQVSTHTCVTGLATTKRGLVDRIIKRIAWRRMPEEKAKGERVAEQRAEAKLSKRLDNEAGELLAESNRRYNERFRHPLLRNDEFPSLFRLHTTRDGLHFTGLHEGGQRFGAPTPPPDLAEPADLTLRLHESLVNNVCSALLAGTLLNQQRAQDITIRVLGELPPKFQQDEEDKEPWSVTFAEPEPVTFRIQGNLAELTIRGQQYTSGTKRYDGMNVTVRYKLSCDGRQLTAVRQGELEILPPGFEPGKDTLSTRETVLRRLLQKRYGKIFEPELVAQGLSLKGRWEKLGPLHATQLKADNGWLVVGWNYDRPAKTAAAPLEPSRSARQ